MSIDRFQTSQHRAELGGCAQGLSLGAGLAAELLMGAGLDNGRCEAQFHYCECWTLLPRPSSVRMAPICECDMEAW